MQKIITITTDLGDQFAAAQLKAVVYSLGFRGEIVENHSVTAFSIIEGAFEIAQLSEFCPRETVHLGIVDPGVGSERAGVVIRTKKSFFVGPNNGLLYPAAKQEEIIAVWKIKEGKISKKFSNTFHGRDIFIKAAVYIAQGKKPEHFGCIKIDETKLIKIKFKTGQVLHVDHYGNIKVHWKKKLIGQLRVNNQELPVVKTFSDVEAGKPLAYWGSHGTLELAVNLGRSADIWEVQAGDKLEIISS